METKQLEALLDGAEETDQLEFKGAMNWDKKCLVKDILAMANIQDGGTIIIGVEDQTFQRQGLTDEQLQSYNADHMRDQIAPFADPRVEFSVFTPTDRGGRRYVVISVSPFDEIPVICKRDGNDVKAGAIYYRSRAQKPQSAQISNSTDLRDVIENSISRRMRKLQSMGFAATPGNEYDYDAELGDL